MAISDPQKVDYLWKKIGYSAAKTQTKSATEESIPSPLQIRGDKVMTQSASIPATLTLANTDTSGIVTTYPIPIDVFVYIMTVVCSDKTIVDALPPTPETPIVFSPA